MPGVGPSISADLRALGIERVADLVGDPDLLLWWSWKNRTEL